MLIESGVYTAVVNSTLVYGHNRSDILAKLVPIFKFLGMFSKKMKPVHVDVFPEEMISKLCIDSGHVS